MPVTFVAIEQFKNMQVLETTLSCPPAMTMLADVCVNPSNQKHRQSLLRQGLHILEQLKVADPLRDPYWRAQLHSLLTMQASAADNATGAEVQ